MRYKLKCGGKKRIKALFGVDGAITAAATLAAAGITAAATNNAAKKQAKAITDSATTNANALKQQNQNNNALQKEQINFVRDQNKENRQQQQDIQTTLQMMAGQENMNDRLAATQDVAKYGGRPKRRKLSQPSYGGGGFRVTDGGGVIPLDVTEDGYGLYELYGNDHEHYHKTRGGKYKTGVGIKFNDGSEIEGEGNQNSNQGELLYVTPDGAKFISKHSIDGFNPTKAVMNGVHPEEAFMIQEAIKEQEGYNDDGTKQPHRSMKRLNGGFGPIMQQANMTQNPSNGTSSVATGVAFGLNNSATSPIGELQNKDIAKHGGRFRLRCGGRRKAKDGIYAGAGWNTAGNLLGAGITTIGNIFAGKRLANAYNNAGNILADAYSQMKGIDLSEIKREDFAAPHTMAVVRTPNTNINPQLERIRRNAAAETKQINNSTLSSAARQQRLAATNDKMMQQMNEQFAYKQNEDEKIKQANAQRITDTANENANRDVQANKDYTNQRLSLMQYNNDIENSKIAGIAQARADAIMQSSSAKANALQNSMNAFGSALSASGQSFANAYSAANKAKTDYENVMLGADTSAKIDAVIMKNDEVQARALYDSFKDSTNPDSIEYARRLNNKFHFDTTNVNNTTSSNNDTSINYRNRALGHAGSL